MSVISNHHVVCVNAMWQTSKVVNGPQQRSRGAWHASSLVMALVDATLERVHRLENMSESENMSEPVVSWFGVALGASSFRSCFTDAEKGQIVLLSASVASAWPDVMLARRTILLLKQLVFARSAGEMLDRAGVDVVRKHAVAGYAMKMLNDISVGAVLAAPLPMIFDNRTAAALGVMVCAASMALDYDAERALRGVIRGHTDGWHDIQEVSRAMVAWRGHA